MRSASTREVPHVPDVPPPAAGCPPPPPAHWRCSSSRCPPRRPRPPARRRAGPADPGAKPYLDVRTPRPAAPGARRRAARALSGPTPPPAPASSRVSGARPSSSPIRSRRRRGCSAASTARSPAPAPATAASRIGYVDDERRGPRAGPRRRRHAPASPNRVKAGGVTYPRWNQEVGGIPRSTTPSRRPSTATAASVTSRAAPRRPGRRAGHPALTAAQARDAVARDVGVDRPATVTAGPTGPRRETAFSTGDRAALVLFGHGRRPLAWQVTYHASSTAWYDAVVDAATGAILRPREHGQAR